MNYTKDEAEGKMIKVLKQTKSNACINQKDWRLLKMRIDSITASNSGCKGGWCYRGGWWWFIMANDESTRMAWATVKKRKDGWGCNYKEEDG